MIARQSTIIMMTILAKSHTRYCTVSFAQFCYRAMRFNLSWHRIIAIVLMDLCSIVIALSLNRHRTIDQNFDRSMKYMTPYRFRRYHIIHILFLWIKRNQKKYQTLNNTWVLSGLYCWVLVLFCQFKFYFLIKT